MAGQTPEPSFQPAGQQDSGLTQGRPGWQAPPGYTPPGGSGAGTGGQAYAAPPPAYPAADQGYAAHDQTYANLGQNPGQDYQDQQGYQDHQGYQDQQGYQNRQGYQDYQGYQQAYQGYGAQQGQDQGAPAASPQWQGLPGTKQPAGRTKSKASRGLIGSLFDFSFASMVTPKIIKALYILFTIWTLFAAVGILFFFIDTGGLEGGLAAIIVVDPIFILLSLGVYRIILEAFMVIFQIHGELKTIREQGENRV